VADEHVVDEHLVAVLNEVLDAVYQAKQAAWSASTSPARAALQDLVSFLIEQSGRFMITEERIDGRSDAVASPSSHQRGNLLAEANGDLSSAVSHLVQRLRAIVVDVQARAADIPDATEVPMLIELAEGLERHIGRLRAS
jgi:hypothetical protein